MPNILSIIADNPALLEALREVMERQFEVKKEELGQTDAELGQIVRARLEGKRALAAAVIEIMKYKSVAPREVGINPGA